MKENINRQHTQSMTSEKNVTKAVKSTQKELTGQIDIVKDAVTKLTEVMVEEFDAVREDYKGQLEQQCRPLFERIKQLEQNASSQIQELSNEGFMSRKGLEQRFSEVKTMVEEEFRRDLDRQKTLF